MTQWYRLKHKETGEEQSVVDLKGYDIDQFEMVKMDRAPEEDDDFDWGTKKVKKNPKKQKDKERLIKAAKINQADLLDMIYELQERVAKLEKGE